MNDGVRLAALGLKVKDNCCKTQFWGEMCLFSIAMGAQLNFTSKSFIAELVLSPTEGCDFR